MPYQIQFEKILSLGQRPRYANDLCVGGDLILSMLAPTLRSFYLAFESKQEDEGWRTRFRDRQVHLVVLVRAVDPKAGSFDLQLSSRVSMFGIRGMATDTLELDRLMDRVVRQLKSWSVATLSVKRLPK